MDLMTIWKTLVARITETQLREWTVTEMATDRICMAGPGMSVTAIPEVGVEDGWVIEIVSDVITTEFYPLEDPVVAEAFGMNGDV